MSTSFARRALRAATQVAVAVSLVAVVAATSHAQGGGRGGQGGQRMMAAIMDSLSLSATQRAQVDSIATAFQAKMPAFTPGEQPSAADRATRQKLMADRTAAIKAVLTAEQATKYDAMMESMRSRMGGGRPPQTR